MQNRKIVVYGEGISKAETGQMPERERNEAIVQVKACGVCGSDMPRIFNNRAYYYPIVLGHEFSGVVTESDNGRLNGRRVSVFPLLPCKKCEFCKRGFYANCVNYGYYGSRRNGGMQDYIAVKEENLVELPENVTFEAGAMLEPVAVCLHAVKKAQIVTGENVAVFGAGTIGLLCAMWAKAFGANTVYVADIDENKLKFAQRLGFEMYNGEKVQAAFECSGAGDCVNLAIDGAKAFGRIVLVGNAAAEVTLSAENYAKILRKQLVVCGSWNSDFAFADDCADGAEKSGAANDWAESVKAISEGIMRPEQLITHKFGFGCWEQAVKLMKNKEFFIKIMMVTEDEK